MKNRKRKRDRRPVEVDPLSLIRVDPKEPVVFTPRGVAVPIVWLEQSELGVHGLAELCADIDRL